MAKKIKKFEEGGSTGGIKTGGLSGAVGKAMQNAIRNIEESAAKYPEMVKPEGAASAGNAMGAAPLPGAVKIEMGLKPTAKDLYEEHMSMISSNRKKDDSLGLDKLSLKKGGAVKAKSKASSASKRADGIAVRGKTRGRNI
jgi:hypothetical protein